MNFHEILTLERKALEDLYDELDYAVEQLRSATGLRCPEGCGACCLRPSREVEASLLEMIPLALMLHAQGSARDYHTQALEAGPDNPCILYQPQGGFPGKGRCSQYTHRPLICRLFGSSALKDKAGRLRISASRVMKEKEGELISEVENKLPLLKDVPLMETFHRKLVALHPGLSVEKYPLNVALAKALEWVGLRDRWMGQNA